MVMYSNTRLQASRRQVRSSQGRHKTVRIDIPYRGTLLEKKHIYRKIMTSLLWHHRVTWRHGEHAQTIAHGRFPIGCPLEPSRYVASFPRYLAPKLRQRLLRDDVINDVIRSGSNIRDDHVDIPYREHCRRRSILQKSILQKNHDVTIIMTSWGHVTSSGAWPIDSP